ncbi:cytochrome P450 4V2-like [Argiope bruennichi]|uniref:cytochrome P450 4V2-like n=1 Tax=Argiope bruennichi TaxID=94029 RepID=UPI002494E39D|nr:cytochrome P450 4V2-like [Argiope bruennichi]
MYLLYTALALLLILILWKFIKLNIWRNKCSQLMPGSRPGFLNPLGDVGLLLAKYIRHPDSNTLHLNFFKLLGEKYHQFRNETMFCLWVAYVPFVMIIKADAAKDLLKGMKTNEKSWVYKFLKPFFGEGLLTSGGEKWKARRKLLTPCFHSDIMKDFQLIFNENCQKLADFFQGETDKDFTIIDSPIKLSSLDMICETIFGVSVNALHNENSQYAKAGVRLEDIFMSRIYNFWMWSDIVFKATKTAKDFYYHLKVLQDFTKSVIKEKKARYLQNQEEFEKKKRKALMDMLLERHFKFQDMNEDDIREEVDTFIMEGHDTIAISMIWTLYLIGLHPEVQAKLHEELDRTFGSDRDSAITIDDLNNLNYMECVIKESNRIYAVVPIFGRQVYEDTEICGYTVPKGSSCMVLNYYLHRDETIFPDPEKFDPDRFLPENAADIPEYGFLPFSAGPRNCIGKAFAMQEMKTILSSILRRFVLQSLDGREKVKPLFHVVLSNSIPVRIRFRNRSNDN